MIQAALTHPEMVEALGHNVPRVFMLVFGGGAALAGLAGVIGGNTFVTEPAMAATVGSVIFVVVVVGGMGSLAGAFLASLLIGVHPDLRGGDRLVAVRRGLRRSASTVTDETFGYALLEAQDLADRADPAVPVPGADPDLPAQGPARHAGGLSMDARRDYRTTAPSRYNVGRWLVWGLFALVLLVAPLIFTSSLALTMLSQMGIAIIVCLSYNMLLGQGGMLSFGHAVYSGLGAFLAIHALNLRRRRARCRCR